MPLIMNTKKEMMRLLFCISLDLVVMPRKQLPISKAQCVKDLFMNAQYGTCFRSSVEGIQILKIKRVGRNVQ